MSDPFLQAQEERCHRVLDAAQVRFDRARGLESAAERTLRDAKRRLAWSIITLIASALFAVAALAMVVLQ